MFFLKNFVYPVKNYFYDDNSFYNKDFEIIDNIDELDSFDILNEIIYYETDYIHNKTGNTNDYYIKNINNPKQIGLIGNVSPVVDNIKKNYIFTKENTEHNKNDIDGINKVNTIIRKRINKKRNRNKFRK